MISTSLRTRRARGLIVVGRSRVAPEDLAAALRSLGWRLERRVAPMSQAELAAGYRAQAEAEARDNGDDYDTPPATIRPVRRPAGIEEA